MAFDPEKVERWDVESRCGWMERTSSEPHAMAIVSDHRGLWVTDTDYDSLLLEFRIYKKAFEDVMYQEFSSNQQHIDNFLESARRIVTDA